MKRIVRLTERDLSRIVRRVINENNDPFSSMYGKTVIFEPTGDVDDMSVFLGYKFEGHVWNGSELDDEYMSEIDADTWEGLKTETIKGSITKITPMTDNVLKIDISPLATNFKEWRKDIYILYECNSNEYEITFGFHSFTKGSFFSDKSFRGKYTNTQLSNYLNTHLPCGGFDLSKSDSMDDEDFGDTLS